MKFTSDEEARAWDLYAAGCIRGLSNYDSAPEYIAKDVAVVVAHADAMLLERRKRAQEFRCYRCGHEFPLTGLRKGVEVYECIDMGECIKRVEAKK